jgi:hypothetical protein
MNWMQIELGAASASNLARFQTTAFSAAFVLQALNPECWLAVELLGASSALQDSRVTTVWCAPNVLLGINQLRPEQAVKRARARTACMERIVIFVALEACPTNLLLQSTARDALQGVTARMA